MSERGSSYDAVKLLAAERPDLIPHLRRVVAQGGEGYLEDVPQDALDEFVRRGLLVIDHYNRPPKVTG